ncbi:MAG: LytTR family DNA-binding domain-containing protein [Muribaculaceae bacterium]|nr:LytTR family DNA-binding domain-containing protein [Muribaculaceae bacterium]
MSLLQVSATNRDPLRCIIVDDEPIARRGLALLAAGHPDLRLEAVSPGPHEALEWLEENSADLVLLDIEMPGIKGIDLAARFPSSTMVVFTTAYSEYAARSYDLDAVDYLLKPIDATRFDRAVRKSQLRMDARRLQGSAEASSMLILRADRKFVKIDPGSILYIEGVKDYVKIHTDSECIVSRITIKSLLERLPENRFLRIHKSYVINMLCIKSYDSTTAILQSPPPESMTVEIPVGASFRSELQKLHTPGK